MSILEQARRAYARLKSQRNGHTDPSLVTTPGCAKSEKSARSPPARQPAACAKSAESPPYQLVRGPSDLSAVVAALDNTGRVGVDVETTGLDPRTDRVRLLSLATDTIDGGTMTYLVDTFAVDPSPLWGVLAEKELVLHNAAFDLAFLARLGFTPGTVHDTMLLSQVLGAGLNHKHKLEVCAERELGVTVDKAEQRSDWSGELTPEQLRYAARDAEVLPALHRALATKIKGAGLEHAAEIETRCLPGMVWLATAGVPFDRAAWEALARQAGAEAADLTRRLDAVAPPRPGYLEGMATWNWDSPAQVKEALAAAGCPVESTEDDALAALDHPLAELLRQHREARKRCTTYGTDWFVKHTLADGRIYADWQQCGAKTGRMASGRPNLQNVPSGLAYRRSFAAPPGRVLVRADYSQIELRIAARAACDGRMMEAYNRGEDLHTLTARSMTGKAEVTAAERKLAKPDNFGLIYGLGTPSLRRKAKADYGLDLSEADAACYRRAFFAAYPGIARWHHEIRQARATETRTLAGRRVLVDADGFFGAKANYVIQGTGGDGVKLALALLWERRTQVPGAFPVLVVHDEIVVECDQAQADLVAGWLKAAMVDAMAPLIDPVPVEVEVKVGKTWAGD
jgi:DNA polymerase-1